MSTAASIREETAVEREIIMEAAEQAELEPFYLADCLRDLQAHLQERAPELHPEIEHWSGQGLCLLVGPQEQFAELADTLEWAPRYMEAACWCHHREAAERKGAVLEAARDELLVVQ